MNERHTVNAGVTLLAALMNCLKRSAALFRSALREIFDEAAYRRFLSRMQMSPSREAYAAFQTEREPLKLRSMKCC